MNNIYMTETAGNNATDWKKALILCIKELNNKGLK
jgi:hypothetical protein